MAGRFFMAAAAVVAVLLLCIATDAVPRMPEGDLSQPDQGIQRLLATSAALEEEEEYTHPPGQMHYVFNRELVHKLRADPNLIVKKITVHNAVVDEFDIPLLFRPLFGRRVQIHHAAAFILIGHPLNSIKDMLISCHYGGGERKPAFVSLFYVMENRRGLWKPQKQLHSEATIDYKYLNLEMKANYIQQAYVEQNARGSAVTGDQLLDILNNMAGEFNIFRRAETDCQAFATTLFNRVCLKLGHGAQCNVEPIDTRKRRVFRLHRNTVHCLRQSKSACSKAARKAAHALAIFSRTARRSVSVPTGQSVAPVTRCSFFPCFADFYSVSNRNAIEAPAPVEAEAEIAPDIDADLPEALQHVEPETATPQERVRQARNDIRRPFPQIPFEKTECIKFPDFINFNDEGNLDDGFAGVTNLAEGAPGEEVIQNEMPDTVKCNYAYAYSNSPDAAH